MEAIDILLEELRTFRSEVRQDVGKIDAIVRTLVGTVKSNHTTHEQRIQTLETSSGDHEERVSKLEHERSKAEGIAISWKIVIGLLAASQSVYFIISLIRGH